MAEGFGRWRHPEGPLESLANRISDLEKRKRQNQLKNQKELTISKNTDSAPTTTKNTTATEELKIAPTQEGSYALTRHPAGPFETTAQRIQDNKERERKRNANRGGGRKPPRTGTGAGSPNTGSGGAGAGETNL